MSGIRTLSCILLLALTQIAATCSAQDRRLESGDKAIAFRAVDPEGKPFEFEPEKSSRWTVLVFLRGYPGYQCPLCTRQVAELIGKANELTDARADVLFVYPGVAKDLVAKANEFLADNQLPPTFKLVIDQDYKAVNAYKIRWEAPRETAYPSTFVVDPTGVIRYAKISDSHGGRAPLNEILQTLGGK